MLEKYYSFDTFKEYYDKKEIEECKKCILFLMLDFNTKIASGEEQPHKLKHLLFKTNCIKNPMGMKCSPFVRQCGIIEIYRIKV